MFKEILKELRKNKKLTQRQIANELDMSQQNYQKWESGKSEPSRETLEKLADYFEVTIDYLVGRSPLLEKNIIAKILRSDSLEQLEKDVNNFIHDKYLIGFRWLKDGTEFCVLIICKVDDDYF